MAAPSTEGVNFLCLGDFGTGGVDQKKVAGAMSKFVSDSGIRPKALLMLGDNFYGLDRASGGFSTNSPRWKNEIEEMYPASLFPGPMHAVLGNHDYHDNPGGQDVQLAYAAQKGVRWHMPAKWYRIDAGPLTLLFLDSNLPSVSGAKDKLTGKPRASLTAEEEARQLAWLKAELAGPRGTFTVVAAHHPIYSNGDHGDTKPLGKQWDALLQQHRVHAYICGHDHDLQHLELTGRFTSHVLSGGGGARTRPPHSERKTPFFKQTYGFTHLAVTGTAMRFTHYDADGVQLHSFTKKPDGSVHIG